MHAVLEALAVLLAASLLGVLTLGSSSHVLSFPSSRYVDPEDADIVGPGAAVWQPGAGRGETSFRLEYVRPFEPDTIEGEFEVMVEVQ